MATLAGNTIASTYPLLLKIDSSGIDGTLRANHKRIVEDEVSGIQFRAGTIRFRTHGSAATSVALDAGGGTERMRIAADGDVGIGTTDPLEMLDISKTNDGGLGPVLQLTNDPGSSTAVGTSCKIKFAPHHSGTEVASVEAIATTTGAGTDLKFTTHSGSALTEKMRIDRDGKVGIGEDSPEHKLHIKLTGDADFNQATDLNGESILYLEGADNDGEATMIRWANNGSMNNYFGCVQVGSTSQADFVWTAYNGSNYAEKLRVKSSGHIIAKQLNQTGSTSNRYPLYWVHTGTDGSIEPYTGSVRAMKKDIADMGSVDWIHSLKPRSFKFRDFEDVDGVRTYKDTTKDNPTTEYGLIAEEVNEVEGSDYILDKNSDGEVKGVLYHNLVPVLLKALQEADDKIDALTARIEALENA